MKLIISPAKQMTENPELLPVETVPVFTAQTEQLLAALRALSFDEARKLWGCNEQLTRLNMERLRTMCLTQALTPAILAYNGLQYKHLAAAVLEADELQWLQAHLRILSGFYGLLRPMDGIRAYRLEMQAELALDDSRNLYEFWSDKLYRELCRGEDTVLDLSSREYGQCIQSYLEPGLRYIQCIFAEAGEDGRLRQKATEAKMARGEMVRFAALLRAETPEQLQDFCALGYTYAPEHSSDEKMVFVKNRKFDSFVV